MSEEGQQFAADRTRAGAAARTDYCFVVDDDAGICKALCFTLRNSASTPRISQPRRRSNGAPGAQPVADLPGPRPWPAGALDVLPILARYGYLGPVQLMSGRSQSVLDEVVLAGERQGLKMLPALVKPFRMGVVKDLVAGLGLRRRPHRRPDARG